MAEKFTKISVKSDVKQEIDILAAVERRYVYEIVADMLKIYKQVAVGRSPKKGKKSTPVSVVEVISSNH